MDRVREARFNLARFPEIGRKEPVPVAGLRRLVVGECVLDYVLEAGTVVVLAIRHGRQRDPFIPEDPLQSFEDDP